MILKHVLAFFGMVVVFHTVVGYPLLAGIVHAGLLAIFVLAWRNPPAEHLLVGYSRHR